MIQLRSCLKIKVNLGSQAWCRFLLEEKEHSGLIGNATNRRACVGLRMLDYFKRQAAVLNDSRQIRNISSDIIESEFGILKSKVSSNKLNGFTRMILMLPLYPKIVVYSDAKKQNFKVRLANVKLKDIDLRAKENLSPNRVVLRSRTLNNAS